MRFSSSQSNVAARARFQSRSRRTDRRGPLTRAPYAQPLTRTRAALRYAQFCSEFCERIGRRKFAFRRLDWAAARTIRRRSCGRAGAAVTFTGAGQQGCSARREPDEQSQDSSRHPLRISEKPTPLSRIAQTDPGLAPLRARAAHLVQLGAIGTPLIGQHRPPRRGFAIARPKGSQREVGIDRTDYVQRRLRVCASKEMPAVTSELQVTPGEKTFTKRNKVGGQFMAQKKTSKFKGVRKER